MTRKCEDCVHVRHRRVGLVCGRPIGLGKYECGVPCDEERAIPYMCGPSAIHYFKKEEWYSTCPTES